jgi:hypothetical protein
MKNSNKVAAAVCGLIKNLNFKDDGRMAGWMDVWATS